MGTQVTGRKRIPNREKVSAEDDALSQIAREAEARLAAKRAARAEAREIRLKELERQQKEIYQAQRKYYGLDSKWGHIEQWMEDSERYSRHSRRHTSISDDEERMSVGSRGSLRPTDYGGFLGSSSRTSSRASSARASPVVEERSDFLEKGSRTASTLSAATLASLGGGFSRRGSCDTSISVDTEASIRDIKDSLVEAEEKYRKAMVSNAQLDNEKSNLMYQVDTLRDTLMELEELLYETRRECEVKTKECDRERHAHNVLQFQFDEMKEVLKQNEELLKKHGISLGSEVTTNGETGSNMTNGPERVESAQDTPAVSSDSVLEIRLRKLVDERESLLEQVRKLKAVVEQKQRNGTNEAVSPHEEDLQNSLDSHIIDLQRDANRQISDLKFKLVKSEQEVAALEQNIIRLEGQVTRYKTASEAAEKVEDELKVEKRKLQRELRSALDRIDELEASNCHLSKRVEKMKANRNAMLSQQ
ncbi:leucine-rich repeat flightless-interacting protein 2 isoform X11 [Ictalurus punctatus]|uniref:Leucine-rich repeat flightless-interacting protein 2 isoform X11 n=1 Tax=Ictalurus punctatus TaxID=7998 RepID=A0A979F4L6_ICTPU|nr:leucine-rich repeat flightless-interacting protein 2 isoform X11 [Ictalurus punctatus]